MSGVGRVNTTKAGLIFGLVIAVAFCTAAIGFGLSKSWEYQRQADDNRAEYAKYTSEKITKSCVGLAAPEKIKCQYESFDAQRENNANQQDLVAQRQSALWAFIMGAAAVIGMALSAVGVWLVKATFDATHEANIIQERAIKNAEVDAQEARNALIDAERAIITLVSVVRTHEISSVGDTVTLLVALKNVGRSGAKAFEVAFCVSDVAVYKRRRTYVRRFSETCMADQAISLDKIEIKRKSISQKYVIGYVAYRTIHGAEFKTYFCYQNASNIDGTMSGNITDHQLIQSRCSRLPAST